MAPVGYPCGSPDDPVPIGPTDALEDVAFEAELVEMTWECVCVTIVPFSVHKLVKVVYDEPLGNEELPVG